MLKPFKTQIEAPENSGDKIKEDEGTSVDHPIIIGFWRRETTLHLQVIHPHFCLTLHFLHNLKFTA